MNIRGVDGCGQPFANNLPLSDTPGVRTHDLGSDITIFPILFRGLMEDFSPLPSILIR